MEYYTKGEWVREELNDQLICLGELVDGAHYYIAEVLLNDKMPDAEYEANAHLIAQAPKLYEAVCWFVETAQINYPKWIQRAIAKVEGG